MSNLSNLPLQDMIAGVVKQASDNLAGKYDVGDVVGDQPPKKPEEKAPDDAALSLTDPAYVEKLASAVDVIAGNVDNIEAPNRGVLGTAIAKMAGESQPAPYGNAGAIQVEASPPGKQQYKHDKPKPGYDSAASEANTPTSKAEMPGGATQIDNNMHSPPGGGSGKTPTTSWENKGPLQKSAAEIAREKILQKLAGEDVMKANISGDKSGGPLVGDGVMDAHQAEDVPSNPTDGGYNSGQRSMVRSNEAATNYTKGEAKKPQAKQLAEVLKNPAFSPKHDSKLREQLRNSGQAGVKIAGANAKAILEKAASQGHLTQETVNQFKKEAIFGGAGGGGGYGGGAPTPPDPSGGKMAGGDENGDDNPKVQKLKKLMMAQKNKESMGGMMGY